MFLTVGERISHLRKEKKLTQGELAQIMNLSKSTIAMYETGKNYPNLKIIKQLCTILDTTGDFLIGLTDNPENNKSVKGDTNDNLLLDKYHKLNELGKKRANTYIDDLLINDKYTKKTFEMPREDYYQVAAYGGELSESSQPPIEELTT